MSDEHTDMVLYRSGPDDGFRWHYVYYLVGDTLVRTFSPNCADDMRDTVRSRGYAVLIVQEDEFEEHGLPQTLQPEDYMKEPQE